ncbi:hypothetical protein H0R92_00910 [Treponema sp. OMZ 840]|uniref:glycosyltransferase family 10 domain-containing protein n=1 Tax=Treponema sp. OMZ 840 TaxID=244313 RepID=UPI003D8E698C
MFEIYYGKIQSEMRKGKYVMYSISNILKKVRGCSILCFDLFSWIKEWYISLFDRRLRYFVYGLSNKGFQHIQHYYYKNFLPFNETQIRPSIYRPHIRFYEVFGGLKVREKIKKVPNKLTVFSTGECVHSLVVPATQYYKDNCISCADISLGFDYLTDKNYIRFPYWLLRFISPTKNKDKIAKLIDEYNARNYKKTQFCALIASHDKTNIRTKMLEKINMIEPVMCAGRFAYNDPTLKTLFNDNKQEYLRQFKFNICPENDSFQGYVTEKIFDALLADCIPIYWGGDRPPEPEVINPAALILFDPDNPEDVIEQIKFLHTNASAYEQFKKNIKFSSTAVDWIYNKMHDLFVLFDDKITEKGLYKKNAN